MSCKNNRNGELPSCIEAKFDGPGCEDWDLCSGCADTLKKQLDETNRLYDERGRALKECETENAKFMRQIVDLKLALEIALPGTIHVLSGHVYGADDKLVEFVDGCARCRIEKLLTPDLKRKHEVCKGCGDVHCTCWAHEKSTEDLK